MPTADVVHDCQCIREFCFRLDRVGHVSRILDVRHLELLENLLPLRLSSTFGPTLHGCMLSVLGFEKTSLLSIPLHRGGNLCCWPPITGAGSRCQNTSFEWAVWKHGLGNARHLASHALDGDPGARLVCNHIDKHSHHFHQFFLSHIDKLTCTSFQFPYIHIFV